jgi:hypothetical protein
MVWIFYYEAILMKVIYASHQCILVDGGEKKYNRTHPPDLTGMDDMDWFGWSRIILWQL